MEAADEHAMTLPLVRLLIDLIEGESQVIAQACEELKQEAAAMDRDGKERERSPASTGSRSPACQGCPAGCRTRRSQQC